MAERAKIRATVGMLVAALGTVAVGVSYAQQQGSKPQMTISGRGMAQRGPLGLVRRGLGLSDEQMQQIRTIIQSRKADLKSVRVQMQQARRGVADAITNDEGEAAIRARSAELAKVQADLAVFRAEIRRQVFDVLTPEQQAKARELRLKALERADRVVQRRKKPLE
jgi:periplasmic protein CpxP/Spy